MATKKLVCKIGVYGIYSVYRLDTFIKKTFICTFGGKNAVVRTDDYNGVFPYEFLSFNHLIQFLKDQSIDERLHLTVE